MRALVRGSAAAGAVAFAALTTAFTGGAAFAAPAVTAPYSSVALIEEDNYVPGLSDESPTSPSSPAVSPADPADQGPSDPAPASPTSTGLAVTGTDAAMIAGLAGVFIAGGAAIAIAGTAKRKRSLGAKD